LRESGHAAADQSRVERISRTRLTSPLLQKRLLDDGGSEFLAHEAGRHEAFGIPEVYRT
jgi:hypothetical protein